ncbi:Outer membrane efflux protein [Pedobacter steynii]|uniref:Outer membrane efflux protein n=1 Tax=Pedobacter steynii TaxID=430522 RepID=A0A1H0C6U0_9SPHI|nr:TolC family protein [Pedobacter steynii]NQX41484.1 TolC family protein [Pedobacter steynii]SDN53541.1 Outer membrane efflux protein [Pedobacter steynii]
MKRTSFFMALACLIFLPWLASGQHWTVAKCLEYAHKNNQSRQSRQKLILAADWERKSVIGRLAPKIDVKAGIDHYWEIPVQVFPGELVGQPAGTYVPIKLGTPWMGNIGIEANLNLVDPQTWQAIRLSALQQQAKKNELLSFEKTLSKNVRMSYYQLQALNKGLSLAKDSYHNYQEIHQLITRQYDKGFTDKIALNQSTSMMKELQNQLSRKNTEVHNALLDLKFWMGFPLADSLLVNNSEDMEILPTSGFITEELPDYESQKVKLSIAAQELKSAKAAWYPSLSLRSYYSKMGFGQSLDFIGQSRWIGSGFIGLQLTVPLFSLSKQFYDPGKQKARLESAELEFLDYLNSQQKHYLEEQQLHLEAVQDLKTQEAQLKLARENVALSYQKLEKGIINMIELRQAQQDLNEATEKLNKSNQNLLQHAVELYYLTSQKL